MTIERVPPSGHVVHGQVTYGDSGQPVRGVRVTVMDAGALVSEMLGETLTDGDGRFLATYEVETYTTRFGRAPDVYLLIHDHRGRLLTSTRESVVRGAGSVQEIHVQLPGGEGAVQGNGRIIVGRRKVDRQAFDELTPEDILEIARGISSPGGTSAAARLDAAPSALDRLRPSPAEDLLEQRICATPLLGFVKDIVVAKEWDRETLLELEEMLFTNWPPHGFASYPCPPFVIYYTTHGSPAVRTRDSVSDIVMPGTSVVVGTTSRNGVPDYVERICFWLQYALSRFTSPPFNLRQPLRGATIQVLVTHEVATGDATGGRIRIRNTCSDDELARLAVHELMHLVQEEYETGGTTGDWYRGREGGAVLAEDFLLDLINTYIAEANVGRGTLSAPHVSLKDQMYKQSLFLKYLSEQHSPRVTGSDEPAIGVETYTALLESFDAHGYTTEAVERAVSALPWHQSFHQFAYLDPARLDLISSETLLGNFWLACYLKDFGRNVPDRRFDFMEHEEPTLARVPGVNPLRTMRPVHLERDVRLASGTFSVTGDVPPFGARFYRIALDPGIDTFRVNFTAGAGFARPLVQVVEVEPGNQVRDILRSDSKDWNRTIANRRSGTRLDHVLVVVAGTDTGGPFALIVQNAAPAPDVTVTRWNRLPGTHYEIDSFGWKWAWVSPDLWVDTNQDGVADDEVVVGQDNKLFIRLRNQGNRAATGIQVEFWYQSAAGDLSDGAWQRVLDSSGDDQVLTGLTLPPQSTNEWTVDWAPLPLGGSRNFSLRAVVTVPGDPNTDNKRCISSFGSVSTTDGFVDLDLIRRPFLGRFEDVEVLVIHRTHGHFTVSGTDLARVNSRRVRVGTESHDLLRLRRSAFGVDSTARGAERIAMESGKPASGSRRLPRFPDVHGHYPTDPRTLPPGIEGAELVTVVHSVHGKLVGGFTWAIRDRRAG